MTLIVPAPPTPAPVEVSRLRLRRALREGGWSTADGRPLLTAQETGALPDFLGTLDAGLVEDWRTAATVRRDDPMVEAARLAWGLTQADIDGIFREAG